MQDYYLRFPSALTAENALRNAGLTELGSHDFELVRIGQPMLDPGVYAPYTDWEGEGDAPIVELVPPTYKDEYLANLRWLGNTDDERLTKILPYVITEPATPMTQWAGGNIAYTQEQQNLAVIAQTLED